MCQRADDDQQCGTDGRACVACGPDAACFAGACIRPFVDADAPFPEAACAVLNGQWPAGENLIVVERGPDAPADGYRLRVDVEALAGQSEPCALDGRGPTCKTPRVCTPRMPGPDGTCQWIFDPNFEDPVSGDNLILIGGEFTEGDLIDLGVDLPVRVVKLLDLPFHCRASGARRT